MPEQETSETEEATVENTVAIVVPSTTEPAHDDVALLREEVARLQAALDTHMLSHAEIEEEIEDQDDGRSDDDSGNADERDGAEEADEANARPNRTGLGGFLFGPIRRRR